MTKQSYETCLKTLHVALEDGDLRWARNIADEMRNAARVRCKTSAFQSIEQKEWKDRQDASERLWLSLGEACFALVSLGVYRNVVASPVNKGVWYT